MKGYNHYRKDRIERTSGGVIVYISDTISYNVENIKLEVNFEYVFLKLSNNLSKPYYLLTIYTPQEVVTHLKKNLMESLRDYINEQIIIIGDLNIHFKRTVLHKDWIKTSKTNGFSQLINKDTRISTSSSSIIDHIYTNSQYFQIGCHSTFII